MKEKPSHRGIRSPKTLSSAGDESPSFDEPCPCGSEKLFGRCCGRSEPCPCHSGLLAEECCYTETGSEKAQG